MAYKVLDPNQPVKSEVDGFTRELRNRWDLSMWELIQNPLPRPGYPFITRVTNRWDDTFLTYSDDAFPYIIQYDVEPARPDDELASTFEGYIRVFNLVPR